MFTVNRKQKPKNIPMMNINNWESHAQNKNTIMYGKSGNNAHSV